MFMGKGMDKNKSILLNPEAFIPFTPPYVENEVMYITLLSDHPDSPTVPEHGNEASTEVKRYSNALLHPEIQMVCRVHQKIIHIQLCADVRDQAIDLALHTHQQRAVRA